MNNEVAPPGWSGTVTAMRIHHSGEISNPWALAWFLKHRGAHAHYKKTKDGKSTGSKVPKKKGHKKHEWFTPFGEWMEARDDPALR